MVLERLFLLFVGHLSICFQGARVERFLNLCLEAGIPVWGVYTTRQGMVVGKTSIAGFKKMRPLARKSGVRVRILKKRGLPFIVNRLWQRTAFACGAMLFILTLYIMGSIVWFVEIEGNKNVPTATVLEAAAELGLKAGAYRSRLTANQLARSLAIKIPELSWVGVELKGSCAIIQVVEKEIVIPDEKTFGHVVAAKSGVMTKIVATKGKAMCKAGDTVTQGQILISGAFSVEEGAELRYVQAAGITEASIWYDGVATSAMERNVNVRTGRTTAHDILLLGNKEIALAGPSGVPFAQYEETSHSLPLIWRDMGLPVEHRRNMFHEIITEAETVSWEVAEKEASIGAQIAAIEQLPLAAEPVAIYYQTEILGDQNTLKVKATVEAIESIGAFVTFTDAETKEAGQR